jgi:hypothetical protein
MLIYPSLFIRPVILSYAGMTDFRANGKSRFNRATTLNYNRASLFDFGHSMNRMLRGYFLFYCIHR